LADGTANHAKAADRSPANMLIGLLHLLAAGKGIVKLVTGHPRGPQLPFDGLGRTGRDTDPAAATAAFGHRVADIKRSIGQDSGQPYSGAVALVDKQGTAADPAQPRQHGTSFMGEGAGKRIIRIGHRLGRRNRHAWITKGLQTEQQPQADIIEQTVDTAVMAEIGLGRLLPRSDLKCHWTV